MTFYNNYFLTYLLIFGVFMLLSNKILAISIFMILNFGLIGCDSLSEDTTSSTSGSSGGSNSGSSVGNQGSCSTINVCVFYFNMTSSEYSRISNSCTAASGWIDGSNFCETRIGTSRTQVCQQVGSGATAQTYSYGHSQSSALQAEQDCENLGGTSNIYNF